MTHTPGPWYFGKTDPDKRLILGGLGNGQYVCSVQIYQTPRDAGILDEETRLSNANLISASPDLLGACKAALDYIERSSTGFHKEEQLLKVQLRAAIAKAEPES